jgi:hypothetical protein
MALPPGTELTARVDFRDGVTRDVRCAWFREPEDGGEEEVGDRFF